MTELTITGTKLLEQHMGMWNSLLQLNVLKKANYKEDEEHYNNINEVVYSIFKIAIQARQLKQEKEGDDTINENYDDYEEEIEELIKKEIAYLQKEHPEILLNMPINLFKRMVSDVLQDKDTMNVAIVQLMNMMQIKENAQTIANGGVVESGGIGGVAGGQLTNGMPVTGGMPMGGMPMGGMPMGGMPMGGIPGQFPQNMGMYPQNQNQNQDATIVPQDTPEGQKAIDEIDKQTGGQFKKKLKSITKNGIHPQVALVATNTGALLAGMLIPGAGFLIMTVTLKANLEILPKWPKKKLIPITENWFKDPNKNNPDKDNPNDDKINPDNPQQANQQMPQNGGWPNNMIGPNGAMMSPNGAMMGPNGAMMGPNGAMMSPNGMVQGGVGGVGVKKPLQIWETVASNLVYTNRIKTEIKLTYYIDKDGKIYINSKEYGIKNDKEYIELTAENLQDYLTFIAQKNGLGETESMKEFIEQVTKIAKGEIGIKEINSTFIRVINASTKLSEMSEGGKLSEYGKEIYNELTLKKLENLVEFDPNQPIEDEIIKQLKETKEILATKLTEENLKKLNEEEREQFTQMLNGVNNTLNMIEIYKGIELIKEKEQEIDLLKDKKKLVDLYKQRDIVDEQSKIQEDKKELDKQIEEKKKSIEASQEVIDLQNKRKELERQFEKELESLYNSLEQSKNIFGDDEIDEKLVEEIENKIKEKDEKLQEIDNKIQQIYQRELNDLEQQKTKLKERERKNEEEIKTIAKSKDEIEGEIKKYEEKVNNRQSDVESKLKQTKDKQINKLKQKKDNVEKLKKEKDEIEKGKKELDDLILNKRKEIKLMEIDKPYIDTKEEVDELDDKIKESQKQLEELILKKQQKEKESKEKDEELKKYRTVENIDKEIDNIEKSYKKQMDDLGNTDEIEHKETEIKKFKEKISQQIQNLMSQELISVQQQLLQSSQFAGLGKIVNVESVEMPQYQAPVIVVEQDRVQDIKIEAKQN